MGFLNDACTLIVLNQKILDSTEDFSCGHSDLNEFFSKDCVPYSKELMGKTYCFTLNSNPKIITCAFTVANDSIKVNHLPKQKKNKLNRKIPQRKHLNSYPSVLIGRLGANVNYRDKRIGDELMDSIKYWFIDSQNKTGCRYIVVDAYNEDKPIAYYKRNGFTFLFDNENDEKTYTGLRLELTKKQKFYNWFLRKVNMSEITSEKLNTRLMFFDLIILKT